jgi:hypothetical protein
LEWLAWRRCAAADNGWSQSDDRGGANPPFFVEQFEDRTGDVGGQHGQDNAEGRKAANAPIACQPFRPPPCEFHGASPCIVETLCGRSAGQ